MLWLLRHGLAVSCLRHGPAGRFLQRLQPRDSWVSVLARRVCGAQVKGVRLVFSKREVDASSGEVYDGATEEEYPLDDFDVPLGDQD